MHWCLCDAVLQKKRGLKDEGIRSRERCLLLSYELAMHLGRTKPRWAICSSPTPERCLLFHRGAVQTSQTERAPPPSPHYQLGLSGFTPFSCLPSVITQMTALTGRNTARGREFQASVREYSWKVDCELEASTLAVLEQCMSSGSLPTGTELGSSYSIPNHILLN